MAGLPLPVGTLSAVVAAAAEVSAGPPGLVQLVQGPALVSAFPVADAPGPAPGLPRSCCPNCEVVTQHQAMLQQRMAAGVAALQAGAQQPAAAAAAQEQLQHDREELQLLQEYVARHKRDVDEWQALAEGFRELAKEQRAALPQYVQQQPQPWVSTDSTFMVHAARMAVSAVPSTTAGDAAAGPVPQHMVDMVGVADLVSDETFVYLMPRGPGYAADADTIANALLLDVVTRLNGERRLVLVSESASEMHSYDTARLLQLLTDLGVVCHAQVLYMPAHHGMREADRAYAWIAQEVQRRGALSLDHLAALVDSLPGMHARIINPAACAAVGAWGQAHYSSPVCDIKQFGHVMADAAWEGRMLLKQGPLDGDWYEHRARSAPFQVAWLDDMQRRPVP